MRPKTVKPQVAKTQASKPQADAVKPSSANMPLQTIAQKPFQKTFQQPMQTHLTKMPTSSMTRQRNMADEKLPIEKNHLNIS